MSTNNYYFRHQNQDNAKKVKQFYLDVLKEFSERLEKQMRYKERYIRSDQIQELEKRVKYKLENPLALFQRFLNMKQGATKIEEGIKNQQNIQLNKNEVKQEYDQANNDYRITSDNRIRDKDSDSDLDDLEEYQNAVIQKGEGNQLEAIAFRPVKSEIEVKKQQNFQAYKGKMLQNQKEIKEEQNQSSNSVEQITNQQCQQHLNSIILSTFNTSTLKHKPKQQKITISLDNSFMKSVYNQFYIGQVQVDINKIQKSQVKIDSIGHDHHDKKRSSR